jgi:Tol biopolymer transport system component
MTRSAHAAILTLALLLTTCTAPTPDLPLQTPPTRPPAPSPTRLGPAQIPVTWAHMALSGQLLLIYGANELAWLDLSSGHIRSIYSADARTWLRTAALSPDGATFLLAYEPPPPEGQLLTGFSKLYIMPADASALPRPLIESTDAEEDYHSPMWSPDGAAIYYSHFQFVASGGGSRPSATLERRPYPRGEPEVLVENALWARLSRDGTMLAWIPNQFDSAYNELLLADGNGANALTIIGSDVFGAIDAPLIAPDGQSVVVSAAEGDAARLSWLDHVTGVRIAAAHGVPSDWWRISVDGRTMERLTAIGDLNLMGDFSPDGRHIAFSSASGLWLMQADGSDLLQIMPGSVALQAWLP